MAEDQKDYTTAEFMDRADVLATENAFLRMQNLQLQLQNIEHQKSEAMTQIKVEQAKLEVLRKELSTKYGVAISPNAVDKDGRLKRPAKPPMEATPLSIELVAPAKN